MSELSLLSRVNRTSRLRPPTSNFGGGLNRSTQHFILEGKDGVCRWIRDFVEGLQRPRRRSYGIAGSAVSRSRRLGERLVRRRRPFISRCHRTAGFVLPLGVARGWR